MLEPDRQTSYRGLTSYVKGLTCSVKCFAPSTGIVIHLTTHLPSVKQNAVNERGSLWHKSGTFNYVKLH